MGHEEMTEYRYEVKQPNWVIRGSARVSLRDYDEEPIEGYTVLGLNGWVHVELNGNTHSFSPAMVLEITWKGIVFKPDDDGAR